MFQERINQLYEEAKDADYRLTQTEYASRFGATRNQLKGWLDGRGEPNSELMKAIAKNHGVSVSWLVGETNIRALPGPAQSQHPNDSFDDLPPEAIRSIKEYIELIRMKYNK
jgi:transcriptional regulator with XRE-family HTH domain